MFQSFSCGLLQVVYPALDAKVKNVTLAYSVEHQDEVSTKPEARTLFVRHEFCGCILVPYPSHGIALLDCAVAVPVRLPTTTRYLQEFLFDQLLQLLNQALSEVGAARQGTIR